MRAHQEVLARELLAGDSWAPASEDVRSQMEAQFGDCARRGLPVAVLFVAVTRLDRRAKELGAAASDVRRAVVEILRRSARGRDLFASEEAAGTLVMLPSTDAEAAGRLCRQAIDEAKKLTLAALPHPIRVGLGIGLARRTHHDALFFETLVLVAREGAIVASNRGGECFVHTMLYEVMQKRAEKLALASGKSAPVPCPAAESTRPTKPAGHERPPAEPARDRSRLEERAEARSPAAEEEIEILRRRIAKLNRALEVKERALEELRVLKGVVPGIASTYREVQGLSPADPDRERKQALLQRIFAANLEIQRLRRPGPERVAAPELVPAAS